MLGGDVLRGVDEDAVQPRLDGRAVLERAAVLDDAEPAVLRGLEGQVAPAADYRAPAISPDGRRIAIRRRDSNGSNVDVWIIEPARGTTTRFTFDPADDYSPIWSPDGSQVLWTSTRGGQDGLWVKSAGGLGQDQLVAHVGPFNTPTDWSRDGKWVIVTAIDPQNGQDLWAVPMTGDHKPQVVLQTPFNESRARFSPDGRWIAYQSDESGRNEVYVASFQGAAGKWQISTNGGGDPAWSPDGRELCYISRDQKFMAVAITSGASLDVGTPRELFPILVEGGSRRNVYEVAPDAKRFLFLLPAGETGTPITAVVNWRTDSRQR